ncbi:MAG: DUF1667 domain-containing protein [Candidatus Omnitrophica bacterium]|nr:DUF1667 domain-containing protein [Candidatus Omnitrophota bacterium]
MNKKIICTQCPKGCVLTIDLQNNQIISITGNECPKGQDYANSEIKNPVRTFTSTVITQGLSLRMLPVKTDKPIPKQKLLEAINQVKKIRVCQPIKVNDIIAKNFLDLDVNLIATRNITS